jgi:hypothetical protein
MKGPTKGKRKTGRVLCGQVAAWGREPLYVVFVVVPELRGRKITLKVVVSRSKSSLERALVLGHALRNLNRS